jgi:hypothetical protein
MINDTLHSPLGPSHLAPSQHSAQHRPSSLSRQYTHPLEQRHQPLCSGPLPTYVSQPVLSQPPPHPYQPRHPAMQAMFPRATPHSGSVIDPDEIDD